MTQFQVKPTENRCGSRDDYILCINSKLKKNLDIGSFAVVSFTNKKLGREFLAPCRVISNDNLSNTQIELDQTLRNALSIPFEYDVQKVVVQIHPLKLTLYQKLADYVSNIIGRRYLFFRVSKANPIDIEKNLCRIPIDAFELLGCKTGDKIKCESVFFEHGNYKLKTFVIPCYGADEIFIKNRQNFENSDQSGRYLSAEKMLNVSPDIPHIFCDLHFRQVLKVSRLDPIRVRRSVSHQFFKQTREMGVIFFLSILAVAEVFPEISWGVLLWMVPTSLIIALLLVLLNIRTKK